jgi:hypothetical protein
VAGRHHRRRRLARLPPLAALRQLARTRRLVARSQPVEGDAAEMFDDLLARIDIRGGDPRLRVSTDIATPQVTGLIHPVILLPVGTLESFSTRELSLTLCHELMHVQRFDLWHGWIPSIAARLFFFHPLARLAAREAAPAVAGASPTLRTLKRRLLMLHDSPPHARRLSPRWWALAAVAALLVIPMRPTAQQTSAEGEPWVFLRNGDKATMHGSSVDLVDAKRLRANSSEPLIWFKQNGRVYVIRDRGMLDKASAVFIPQHGLSKAQSDLEVRQTILGEQQTALGKTQEALREHVRAFSDKVNDATAAMLKKVDLQIPRSEDAKQQAQLEASLRQAEASRRQVQAEQEALGVQQRAIGEHQAALGAEQEILGRQQEELARAMTWEMRILIDKALAAGLATPVK